VGKDQSADAALVITPSFYRGRMTDSALQTHYEAVADASPIPVILYSVPMNTNLDLSVDVILKLAEHKNIIGLKDSSGDIGKISRIVYATKDQKFQVLVGSAGVLLPALLMGSVGGICGLANILPNQVCEVYDLFRNNQLEAAISLQQRLVLPNIMVTRKFGVSGLKKVMDMVGLYGGPTRPPLLPVEPAEVKQLKQVFQEENFMKSRA
jgi:4-hydroxy-2-oxoglutarate aldolase